MGETTKEATIVLKLDAREYAKGLAGLDRPAGEAGAKSGSAFSSAFSSGLKGARSAVEGLYSTIKGGVMAFSGIAGAAGAMDLIRHAQQATGTYSKLAFQIQAGTGKIVDFREMMEKAKGSSVAWGKNVDDLGGAMARMFQETGKIEVANENIDTVAMVARASKEPVDALAGAAGMLSKRFKIAKEDMGDSLGILISAGAKGGTSFEDLTGHLGHLGSIAHEAGLEGKEGLSKIVAMLHTGEESSKNMGQALRTVTGLVTEFGKKAARDKILMHLGISPGSVKGGIDEMLKAVIAKTGGSKEKLQVAFKNEAQVEFLVDMGKSYAKSFAETSGDVRTKSKAATEALEAAMKQAAKSHMNEASLREIATKKMQGGAAKMDAAIEKMKAAFMRDEVTSAIGKLADALPLLADRVVSVVDFIAKHPILGGAALVGGVAAKGAAGAALPALLSAATSAATGAGAAAGSAAAAAAAPAAVAASSSVYAAGAAALAAPLAAFALAAGGVALAINQGTKLAAELKGPEVVDANGKRVNKLGPDHGNNDLGMWETLKHDVGYTSDKDWDKYVAEKMGRSMGADQSFGGDAARRTVDHATSSTGASSVAYGTWEENMARQGISVGGPRPKGAPPAPPKPPPHAPTRSKEDAALLAEMLGAKTLKVQIDPAQIAALQKAMSGGGGGGPAPGYVDRP